MRHDAKNRLDQAPRQNRQVFARILRAIRPTIPTGTTCGRRATQARCRGRHQRLTFFLDVSLVINNLRATGVRGCIRSAALTRTTQDHQVLEVAREAGGVVVPILLSSFGGYGEKAPGFISTLRSALLAAFDPFSDCRTGKPLAHLLRGIAAATQRGNAAAVLEARHRFGIRGRDAANLIKPTTS